MTMLTVTEESFLNELRENNIDFNNINELLVAELIKKKMKIATAESCTGGFISKKITEVSGSSAVFDCGVCSYSNDIKAKVLGVNKDVLDTLGAVSEETAKQMALGVKNLAQSHIGVSTTGIAGPTGETAEKPVGLVYIGVSTSKKLFAVKALFSEDKKNSRERVRELSTVYAMYIVYKVITNDI